MQICQIPYEKAGAADNMAVDSTMLEFGFQTGQALWRTYGWTEPAITFGYSQHWKTVQSHMPDFHGQVVRRQTGGGLVDHQNDLTYSLTIPPSHPFHRVPALKLYNELHQHIAGILQGNGFQATLAPCGKPCGEGEVARPPGVCFDAPEPYDVIHPASGKKLAGAAMKRTRSGILIQGSLSLKMIPGLSKSDFADAFGRNLSIWLEAEPVILKGLLPTDVLKRELDRFSSREWNRRR